MAIDAKDFPTLDEALEALDDVIGTLQELHHRFSVTEDLSAYGVLEGFINLVESTLERYDSLD